MATHTKRTGRWAVHGLAFALAFLPIHGVLFGNVSVDETYEATLKRVKEPDFPDAVEGLLIQYDVMQSWWR